MGFPLPLLDEMDAVLRDEIMARKREAAFAKARRS